MVSLFHFHYKNICYQRLLTHIFVVEVEQCKIIKICRAQTGSRFIGSLIRNIFSRRVMFRGSDFIFLFFSNSLSTGEDVPYIYIFLLTNILIFVGP
jgi:hypothetical protein